MAGTILKSYWERIDSMSPSTAAFGMDGGSAQIDFIVNRDNLQSFLKNMLGDAKINANGSLNRTIPMAHPEFNWMYASRINSFQGIGAAGISSSGNTLVSITDTVERNIPEFVALYEKYRISVQFEPRPYLLLTDAQTHQYKNQTHSIDTGGNMVVYDDYAEYLRYTRIEFEPSAELLPSNNGSFFWHSPELPGGFPQAINAAIGAGPKIVVVKNKVKITWFFVPYKLVTNINFKQAYGRINYELPPIPPFVIPFFGFEAGSLLFEGLTVNDYPGAFPATTVDFGAPPNTEKINESIYANKYCDIVFNFSNFQVPPELRANSPVGALFNLNVISENHNRLPHPGIMKYAYSCNAAVPANGRPIYWSYNMSKLFRFDTA